MSESQQILTPPPRDLFAKSTSPDDLRLGEIVGRENYDDANIVILGCPQDEGIKRLHGREGSRGAPQKIREQFYKLTPFGIHSRIYDAGDVPVEGSLEDIHRIQTETVAKFLTDGKLVICLGGGGDLSYADGAAMASVFGSRNWLALHVDSRFDIASSPERNSQTAFRQLLDENLLGPEYFYELGFQPYFISPAQFRNLQNAGVNLVSLDQLRAKETTPDAQVRDMVREKFIRHSSSLDIFFGFDLSAVRASEAPGATLTSAVGLRSGEFLNLVAYAGNLVNTKVIEFTEINPEFDVDDRTAKLVAIAMHKFCGARSARA
jgi:formiminoglutamase